MKNTFYYILIASCFLNIHAIAWNDQTHISVGKAAGFKLAYNLAAPDVAKLKAKNIEAFNHYVDVPKFAIITADIVRKQIENYNSPTDSTGHLYGAIVVAVRDYIRESKQGKSGRYNLCYAGHYIGDLSMPLHNMDYNEFNKKNHFSNDDIIESEISDNLDKIIITEIKIENEDDLINAIVEIANESRNLAYKLEGEQRNMTKEEAYWRISRSSSLFKAVLKFVGF
ncbi:MAG: hypothetical protein NT007_12315 [Candidatus Kapabacteria bacterium]|nr:hypothetical protein [Candidatus Kapabacteria bacterium]